MHNGLNDKAPPSHLALSGEREEAGEVRRDAAKLIAFYLPQFHRIPENSEWWGPGFTEWTNVAKGRPNFEGHYQPHIPRELGFYDLSNVETMREQAELARLYGIHGFCFYHYWFSGRRVLERPLENFLESDVRIDFCVCWANENWTRTWNGDEKSVLLEQKYADGDEERFIESLVRVFSDPRYIRVDGKPMLLVYRAKHMPDPRRSIAKWRAAAALHGFAGLHVVAVDFYDISDPREVGADALVEFPPHKFNGPENHPDFMPPIINPDFAGEGIVDYSKIITQSSARQAPSFTLYRSAMPGWDNTARRQNTPTIIVNSCPRRYGAWLRYLRAYARRHNAGRDDHFIFVNAWNEWGEGCHLEPDQRWGLQYLEETYKSGFYQLPASECGSEVVAAQRALVAELMSIQGPQDIPAGTKPSVLAPYLPRRSLTRTVSAKLARFPRLHRLARAVYLAIRRHRG